MFSQQTDPENSGSQWIAVTISDGNSPDFDFTAQLSPTQLLVSSTSLLPSAKESGRFTTNHPLSAPCLLPYSIKQQQHHLHYSQQSSSLTIQQTGPPVRKNTVSSGLSHNKLSALQQTLINRTLIDFPNSDKNFNLPVHGDDNKKNCCACGGNCSEDQVRHVHSCVCRVITGQQNEKAKCNSSSGCEQVKQVSIFFPWYFLCFVLFIFCIILFFLLRAPIHAPQPEKYLSRRKADKGSLLE